MIGQIAPIFIAFSGFLLALYLFHKKRRRDEPLICPLRGRCHEVIHSQYSRFLGVGVEVIGMCYYAGIAIGYGLVSAVPEIFARILPYLLVASVLAFLFSLYLTFIQVVVLRKLCTWCLLSATFCTVIAALAILGSLDLVIPFTQQYLQLFLILHIMAMALGVGGATLADVFFFKFLKDFKISEQEADILGTISDVIWFALGVVLITGAALFLPQASALVLSGKFLAKMVVVSVIILNGLFLTLLVTPRLIRISFGERHEHIDGELRWLRRAAFTLGPISIISWYTALILGLLPRDISYSFNQIITVYLVIVIIGMLAGQFVADFLRRKSS